MKSVVVINRNGFYEAYIQDTHIFLCSGDNYTECYNEALKILDSMYD